MMELVHTHIAGCFEARATPLDNPATPLEDAVWGDDHAEVRQVRVTNDSAQTLAPWWEAIVGLANDVAQLPVDVYKRRADGGRDEDRMHPVAKVLGRRPNKEMPPFTFKHLMMMRLLSWGNAYAYIERSGADVVALWPLNPEAVTPFRTGGELYYYWQDDKGNREILSSDEMFHLRGPGDDGLCGKSMFKVAKDALSVGLQAQQYGSRFFQNDASPGMVLEFPEAVDEPTAKNILKHWSRRHGGARNAGRPAFLDRGGKVSPFSITNKDAEFIASRQFSKGEVASFFHLPPHKVGDLSRATYSNIEQQSIDYVIYSLMPWLIRWHEECNVKLFRPSEVEADSHYVKFNVRALLRGDFASQMAGFQVGLGCGVYNHDEVRDFLDLNRLPNGLGQQYYHSQNMIPLGTELEPKPAAEPFAGKAPPTDGNDAARSIFGSLLINELSRAYQRIGKGATRACGSPGKLQAWLDEALKEECRTLIQNLQPACDQAAAAGIIDREPHQFAYSIQSDFRELANGAANGDPSTLQARFRGLVKRMTADRPSQLVSELWSD